MITLVALIDATAALVTLLTLMILLAHRRSSIGKAIRVLLIFLFVLSFVHNIGNLLEWAGISHVLETYEDFVVALIPTLIIFVIYIHLQRLSEEQLRQTKKRYEVLFNSGNDSLFVYGSDDNGGSGPFTAVNELACKLLGYTRRELLTLSPLDITSPDFHDDAHVTSRKLRQRKRLIFESVLVGKEGQRIPVEISSSAIEFAGKTITLAVARDLSVRRGLEEQVRRSQRLEAIGRLAGGIAHDFNNLLTVIGGYSDVLLEELEPASSLVKEVQEIRTAADRASSLTRQLLAFGRKQILQPKTIDLARVVRKSELILNRVIGEDVIVSIEDSQSTWKTKADPGQIEQVILNLAINSRDAMPEGGTVTIGLANARPSERELMKRPGLHMGEYVRMNFSDSGIGMDSETLTHIFEPFYTTKELGKGSGLGLSTVYGIIKQSGGFIYATSEPGMGTTVEIYMPRVKDTPPTT